MKEIALFIAVLNVIFIGYHSYAMGKESAKCAVGSLDRFHLFMAVIHGTAGIASMLLNY